MKKLALLFCLSICFNICAQKSDEAGLVIYDYEKVIAPFYNCEIFICTTNTGRKDIVVEIRDAFVRYSKSKAEEWIKGVQSVIDANTGKTKNGKRTAMYMLSDSESYIYFNEKEECFIKFGPTDKVLVTKESAKKLMEGFRVAYEKM